MRQPRKLYSLARPKLRQSWNKFNLYNIMRRRAAFDQPAHNLRSFFQQQWTAKSKLRAYHGEHIPEKKWVRLFSRRLASAVEMPPSYLAAFDGSEQASGRGSGLTNSLVSAEAYSQVPKLEHRRSADGPDGVNEKLAEAYRDITPYMQMLFAPLERRLDTAVFRALFASSVRQARQFVVHGAVKVNGKKMVHPAYQLNPGDMFQVDVEKVLYGTGEQKAGPAAKRVRENIDAQSKREEAFQKGFLRRAMRRRNANDAATTESTDTVAATEGSEEAVAEDGGAEDQISTEEAKNSLSPEDAWRLREVSLKYLLQGVKKILAEEAKPVSAKHKKQLRLFRVAAKRFLSLPEDKKVDSRELAAELQLEMQNHELLREKFAKLVVKDGEESTAEADEEQPVHNRQRQIDKGLESLTEEQKEKAVRIMGDAQLSKEEMRRLAGILRYDEENPIDESKPYATPWRPRAFMPAFAFIPRYLEVNQNICAAVYLRHPVARKGLAEVPTPFSYLSSQLAHNWYLQRG